MPNYAIGVGLDGTATYCTTRGGGKGVGIRDSPEWREGGIVPGKRAEFG